MKANTHDHIYLDVAKGMIESQGQIIDSGSSCTLVVITIDVAQSGHLYVFFILLVYQLTTYGSTLS